MKLWFARDIVDLLEILLGMGIIIILTIFLRRKK